MHGEAARSGAGGSGERGDTDRESGDDDQGTNVMSKRHGE
jgi:hypothetical protein